MGSLKGYRTYILGGLAVAGAFAGYLVGDLTLIDALNTAFQGAVAVTIRSAIG